MLYLLIALGTFLVTWIVCGKTVHIHITHEHIINESNTGNLNNEAAKRFEEDQVELQNDIASVLQDIMEVTTNEQE